MAQSGYTPILIYASGTTGNTPDAANLTSSASGAELALNYFDGKLFYKDSGNTVRVLATKGTGTIGGSNTQVQYNSSGALAGSSNMTFDGTSLTLGGNPTLSGGTANGVAYLNGSKVLTTGSALTFDGTTLQVGGGIGLFRLNASASDYSLMKLAVAGTNYGSFGVGTGGEVVWNANSLHLWNVNSSEGMRLTSTGLGIGTSSPSAKLEIKVGNIRINNPQAGNTAGTESAMLLGSQRYDGSFDRGIAGIYHFVPTGSTYGQAGGLIFKTSANDAAATERMRLDENGNLGLGVTPSSSTLKMLQGPADFVIGTQSNGLYLANNAYYNAGWKYAGGGAPSRFSQDNGAFQWHTAASGTAGNAITFTQAMTLDSSGNLLLGTTTAGNYKSRIIGLVRSLQIQNTESDNTDKYGLIAAGQNASGSNPNGFTLVGGAAQSGVNSVYIGGGFSETNAATAVVFFTAANATTASGTERARIDSSGNFIQTVNTTAATLTTNQTLTFSIVNNSLLRISVRGSDGTTRTATLALA